MSRLTKNATIPLRCTLCPKEPQFSDISHLLTHISSKGHLSCRFKLQIRCQGEPEARKQLAAFDTWYADNGLEDLLAERLATKEQKNTVKRTRSFQKPITKDKRIGENVGNKVEDANSVIGQLLATSVYKAPVPRMHIWSTSPRLIESPFDLVPSSQWDKNDGYATPTMKRFVPNFTHDDSPDDRSLLRISPSMIKQNGFQSDTEGDSSKLKGVYWPGMNLFDSATAEMKRMRNQRKDGSILAQMKTTSRDVEPNEIIYNTQGELQRVRDIYDSSVENSPAQSEKAPSPKKRRSRKTKAFLNIFNSHGSDTHNPVKGGRPKRPSAKRKAAVASVGAALQQKIPRKNKTNALKDISNNLFSAVNDEDEEFRLTVEDMGEKRQLNIFKDAVEDSPGRTESPLEDHRFDFSHSLPLEKATSNMIAHTSPRVIQSPLAMRFGGKENLQPDYSYRRSGATGQAYPPQAFHDHTANPLIYHPYSYTFGFGESPAFHGDFTEFQPGFAGDFKPAIVPGPLRESSSNRHQNEFINNGFSYTM